MSTICSHCGMTISDGYRFCDGCGSPVDVVPGASNILQTKPYSQFTGAEGRALHVLTGDSAGKFVHFYPKATLGRSGATFNIDDAAVSAVHACIRCEDNKIFLEDSGSLNGVFLRVYDKTPLHDHDIIQAGRTLFLYEEFEIEKFSDNAGTIFYASPCRSEHFRLVEILENGMRGRAYASAEDGITVGRLEGNFIFASDETMSPKHFTVRGSQHSAMLIDHSSENGTFVQIHEPTQVEARDQFFIGRTLFEII